jgi:hypothetical protein
MIAPPLFPSLEGLDDLMVEKPGATTEGSTSEDFDEAGSGETESGLSQLDEDILRKWDQGKPASGVPLAQWKTDMGQLSPKGLEIYSQLHPGEL